MRILAAGGGDRFLEPIRPSHLIEPGGHNPFCSDTGRAAPPPIPTAANSSRGRLVRAGIRTRPHRREAVIEGEAVQRGPAA